MPCANTPGLYARRGAQRMPNSKPSRLCECGCGEPVKGNRTRFLYNHHRRLSPLEYIEQDCGYSSPCWVWQRSQSAGYGTTWNGKRTVPAHRVIYERHRGPIPAGHQLDHLCLNLPCVNPDHLEPVLPVENTRRGRRAKLTLEIAREARRLYSEGLTLTEIGRRLGTSMQNVYAIVNNKSWRE